MNNRQDYYDMLERTQRGDLDVTEWLVWCARRQEQAYVRALDELG